MRLFLYYWGHTIFNTLKRMMKTWLAILLVCAACFGLMNAGAVGIGKLAVGDTFTFGSYPQTRILDGESEFSDIADALIH